MAGQKKARGAAAHHRANAVSTAAKSTTVPSLDSEIVVDLRTLLAKATTGTRELRPARAVLFSHFVAERLREGR